jgi:3-(methylthio)propanoyl-CoA dehydrogenase
LPAFEAERATGFQRAAGLWKPGGVSDYTPPLADIRFVMDAVADLPAIVATEQFGHVDVPTVHDVLAEVGRLMAEVVAPTNRDGDTIGSQWHPDGTVVTPASFKPAYAKWVESGFGAMPFDPDYGGAGFPWITAIAVQEMLTSANMGLSLCPLLTQGAIDAIHAHGTDDQKATYLPKMLTGEWTGTMNLTEPHAGSDVGAVTSKAVPAPDVDAAAWRITGQKIFITWGEQDLTENTVHLVLARTPGSPPGTKGISMFLVPKFLVNADGSLGERNAALCVSIEHKLGIHGSPTCVMSYESAIGWLVGGEHDGMRNMFTMMNNARLSVGLEGLAISERAYQQALAYAQERTQGRAIGAPAGTSSPIIDHPDVRRMLMTQRAWIDAMRCLVYTNAAALDLADAARADGDVEAARRWQERADLLIPLSKGVCTDVGNEMTSLALQIHGGMGYVEETGAAQHYRDIRIAAIYEGTNGIQAADLVGRKLAMRGGDVVREVLAEAEAAAAALDAVDGMKTAAAQLVDAVAAARSATEHLVSIMPTDQRSLLAGSSPYLRLLGTAVCGGLLAKGAAIAATRGDAFHQAKVVSARFFLEQILPATAGLLPAVLAPSDDLYALTPTQLA